MARKTYKSTARIVKGTSGDKYKKNTKIVKGKSKLVAKKKPAAATAVKKATPAVTKTKAKKAGAAPKLSKFGKAFAAARKAGKTTFMYEGEKIAVKLASPKKPVAGTSEKKSVSKTVKKTTTPTKKKDTGNPKTRLLRAKTDKMAEERKAKEGKGGAKQTSKHSKVVSKLSKDMKARKEASLARIAKKKAAMQAKADDVRTVTKLPTKKVSSTTAKPLSLKERREKTKRDKAARAKAVQAERAKGLLRAKARKAGK